jgi:hypothetical protein
VVALLNECSPKFIRALYTEVHSAQFVRHR